MRPLEGLQSSAPREPEHPGRVTAEKGRHGARPLHSSCRAFELVKFDVEVEPLGTTSVRGRTDQIAIYRVLRLKR